MLEWPFHGSWLTQCLHIAQYRNEWNYSATELPDPRRYYPYEPTAVDKWPSLITVVMGMGGLAVDDYTEHEPEYGVFIRCVPTCGHVERALCVLRTSVTTLLTVVQ